MSEINGHLLLFLLIENNWICGEKERFFKMLSC